MNEAIALFKGYYYYVYLGLEPSKIDPFFNH